MSEQHWPRLDPIKPAGPIFGGHIHEGDHYYARRPQGRDDCLIVYTLEGKGRFQTAEGEKICSEGEIGLLRADTPHEYGTMAGMSWNFLWVHFPKLQEIDYLPREEVTIHSLPEGSLRQRVQHAFENIIVDAAEDSGFSQALCESSLRGILLLIASRLNKKLDTRIERTLSYLTQHMTEDIRIETLARTAGLSPSRLSHLFKQETGMTILEYLNQMRLRQAAQLMEHMGRTATEAALDVGFNHYNHFAELFKKAYGSSPRIYLQKHTNKQTGEPDRTQ